MGPLPYDASRWVEINECFSGSYLALSHINVHPPTHLGVEVEPAPVVDVEVVPVAFQNWWCHEAS